MEEVRSKAKMFLAIAVHEKALTVEQAQAAIKAVDRASLTLEHDDKKLDEISKIYEQMTGLGGI